MKLKKTRRNKEKVLIATLIWGNSSRKSAIASLEELMNLVQNAGGEVCAKVIQRRPKPDSRTYFGSGKVREMKSAIAELEIDTLAIDASITPSQQKNLEDKLKVKVIDRPAVILDIFASHAHSLEGKLQVELAQLTYLLPRLRGRGTELSRLGGGIGTRGPGETKLEVDRRRIEKRITSLKKRLKEVEKHRRRIRTKRQKNAFTVTLIGYTNAGKSTLLNALTNSSVLAHDKLFATLDPTTRQLYVGDGSYNKQRTYSIVLTDTVGFIENLPHELIAAFHSTLEEVRDSDLLVHVVNSSHPQREEQIRAVEKTLKNIKAEEVSRITVFNKIDLIKKNQIRRLKNRFQDALFVSALEKSGLGELRRAIAERAEEKMKTGGRASTTG